RVALRYWRPRSFRGHFRRSRWACCLKARCTAATRAGFSRLNGRVEQGFERLRSSYAELLAILLTRRLIVPIAAAALLALGAVMFLFVGRDFFPAIDGGQIQLHVRV